MIKRISIQNFKSLKNVTLDLQRVNLLIGPNNSGKTNFLKGLEFLKYALFKKSNSTLEFSLMEYSYKHEESTISFNVFFEEHNVNKHIEIQFGDIGDGITIIELTKKDENNPYNIINSAVNFEENKGLFNSLKGIRIYKPDASKILNSYPLIPNDGSVNADVSDIIAFFDRIRDSNPEIFEAIQADLTTCTPEFSGIRFLTVLPNEVMKSQYGDKTFKMFGLYHTKHKEVYWANELSEGTIYFLALLCIIHQLNPPKLLLLEEPERGIHPRRIQEVMDFIFRLAEEKDIQVIMTSHNENVVNYFSEMPESIFVFDKDEEGATQVRNLLNEIILPSHQKSEQDGIETIDFTSDLGKNWVYGLLGGVPE